MRNFLSNFLERLETRIYKFHGNGNGKYPVTELPRNELRFESIPVRTGIDTNSLAKNPLDSAINSAQQYLLSNQNHSDGHLVGILEADTTVTSDYIMLMHFLGRIDHEKQRKAVNLLLEHQLPDGGWNIYYGGPSEISASVKAYFAFKLAGYSSDELFMQKAKKCILDMGGIMKTN